MYIIYQCLDSEDISIIITPPEHHNCEQKDTPSISDEFKDKKVIQDLIEKQIKNKIKDKENKFLPPSPDPYPEYYLSTVNNDNDESQINKDDTYGYNNSKISKSKIYINIEDNTVLGSESFYYLDEENNKLYQVCYSFNPIMCYEKKYHKLGDNYISLEEFFDKSTFIGENMVDLNMYIYGLIYKMNDYLLCKKGSKFCLKYRKTLYKTDAEQYIHLDEFKDIKHLIHLIQKQIEQTIEDEKKKAENSNLQSYGYNNSRKRR